MSANGGEGLVAQLVPARTERRASFLIGTFGRGAVASLCTSFILKDDKGKLYKGVTNNLERRLREHRSGHTVTTSRMNGVNIVHKEEFPSFAEARQREKYLKTAAGRRFIKFYC